MNKYYSFTLSIIGFLLIFFLYFHFFWYALKLEFKDTILFRIQEKDATSNVSSLAWKNIIPLQKDDISSDTLENSKTNTPQVIEWLAFGDTHFTRGFTHYIKKWDKTEDDYFTCFSGSNEGIFSDFDIVSVNFESSIGYTDECASSGKSIQFQTEPEYVKKLKQMGFTHFNLANNHSYDCGFSGYEATKKHLDDIWVKYFWEGRKWESVILKEEINGIKVAHIGMENVEVKVNLPEKEEKIKKLKEEGYIVIVNIHFWAEYQKKHSQTQEFIAHTLVDAGANIIIWHHPHVIQDFEVYNGVPIYYSLWNFIFDQPFEETLQGYALVYRINANGTVTTHTPYIFERDKKHYHFTDCEAFKKITL